MLRESTEHATDWCENTMSMLRERQFEACEKRLSEYAGVGLFSNEATDADAQRLLEHSYYITEGIEDALTTLEALRTRVMSQLEIEAMVLSPAESDLLERLLMADGKLTINLWDETAPAEALISRLWCGFSRLGEEEITLELPVGLRDKLLLLLHSQAAVDTRERLYRFDATIHGLLYIAGFLHSAQPVDFFMQDVICDRGPLAARLAVRYLKASFEYIADVDNELILLHPGLADPYRLVRRMSAGGVFSLELTEQMIAGGVNGLLPEEAPLHEGMCGALSGALRPEYESEEAAEDLRMLAKQGISMEAMETVMESMLCVMPTDQMKYALEQLYRCTPHWLGMEATQQH